MKKGRILKGRVYERNSKGRSGESPGVRRVEELLTVDGTESVRYIDFSEEGDVSHICSLSSFEKWEDLRREDRDTYRDCTNSMKKCKHDLHTGAGVKKILYSSISEPDGLVWRPARTNFWLTSASSSPRVDKAPMPQGEVGPLYVVYCWLYVDVEIKKVCEYPAVTNFGLCLWCHVEYTGRLPGGYTVQDIRLEVRRRREYAERSKEQIKREREQTKRENKEWKKRQAANERRFGEAVSRG